MANSIKQTVATSRFWVSSAVIISLALQNFAPQYLLSRSFTLTAFALYFAQWFTYFFYSVIVYPRFFSPLRNLPTPPGGSLIAGQFPTLLKEPSGIPMRRWANEIPNDGLIMYRHLWNHERLLVTSPKALAEVLTTKSYDFVKPELLRSGIGKLLGIGILFAEGDEHKMQRKNLMPAFSFRHIKELYPIFWAKSQQMVNKIEAELPKDTTGSHTIEVGEWGSRATLDIIGAAGLGQDFNSLNDPDNELNKVYRSILSPSRAAQIMGALQFFLPAWILQNIPVKRNQDMSHAAQVARDTSRRLIEQKKQKLANKEQLNPDIISVALESGVFTSENLVDNMMTFLAAGHETTASSFSWAVYMLAQHKDIQSRLRAEVHEHIPSISSGTPPVDHELIDNMPYLHAVCQEILRLWSPVPLTIRDTAVDTTILGHPVPAGTKIVLSPWAINHNKALWGEDAGEFKPSRWLAPGQANAGGAVSNYAFLTFLHGPRSCIGSRFAVAEFACLLAAFVGRYEFELTYPDEKLEIRSGITARPKFGVRVNVKLLDW